MKIAFTHNLQTQDTEAQAEFDTQETVTAICAALRQLGHEVMAVDVGAVPLPALVRRLTEIAPDLVFNTAEGDRGRARESFYPALFEQLGLPFTGSDAYTCLVTLDKHLSKVLVAARDVPTPHWTFATSPDVTLSPGAVFPLIVKPNFEGSSKGITARSVVRSEPELRERLTELLTDYPDGVIIEAFIPGHDVVVPFIEGIGADGVLPAADYQVDAAGAPGIYDYQLKHGDSARVHVRVPALLDAAQTEAIARYSKVIFEILGVRDLGRIDFRIGEDGAVYFLEVNALPSLEPGAAIHEAAAQVGLVDEAAVLDAVIQSACARQRVTITKTPARAPGLRVGLLYNLKRATPRSDGSEDTDAEFDSQHTIEAISEAIESWGHEVVPLEATPKLLGVLPDAGLDVAFNIAEGLRGRNREAQIPALLELLGIPFTGSDAAALAITLDKGLAKRVVRQAGVSTPSFMLMLTGDEPLASELSFPLIVKPVAEGSSKGVVAASVVEDEAALRALARTIIQRYRQGALVETYLPGREFTVGVLGNASNLWVLPPMEIIFTQPDSAYPVYSFAHKLEDSGAVRYELPAKLSEGLQRALDEATRAAFVALGCRDVARIDFRLDAQERVHFIECNPLPGLTPKWSDLCQIATAAKLSYRDLIARILEPALQRRIRGEV